MGALITLFLTYLPDLVKAASAVPKIIGFIQKVQVILKEDKEWTVERQMQFDKDVETITSQEHWKTDEEREITKPAHPRANYSE